MRRDHLDPSLRQGVVQGIAVVGLVADDALRLLARQHEVEQSLHQPTLVPIRRCGVDGHREAPGVHQDHDLHAFTDLCAADPVPSALGLAERGVKEALIEAIPTLFLDASAGIPHDRLEHTCPHPLLKPPMYSALGPELRRQVFPLRTVVENPEDPRDNLSLIGRRSPAQRASGRIWDPLANPIEFLFCDYKHASL
jgi:hypothetical protein